MPVAADNFVSQRVELSAGPIHYREGGGGRDARVRPRLRGQRPALGGDRRAALSPTHRCILPDWPMGSHSEAMSPDADLTPPAQPG